MMDSSGSGPGREAYDSFDAPTGLQRADVYGKCASLRPLLMPDIPHAPDVNYRLAAPDDIHECAVLRGRTRENAISLEQLTAMGITVESWVDEVKSGLLTGYVHVDGGSIVGYCFGEDASGEIVVLALLPSHENRGIGRRLLALVVNHLSARGHARLFLGCSVDPAARSHGFYRHLGWVSTGTLDRRGDEVLELFPPSSGET
jgi:GNAT superfamily N-acetyltransferase